MHVLISWLKVPSCIFSLVVKGSKLHLLLCWYLLKIRLNRITEIIPYMLKIESHPKYNWFQKNRTVVTAVHYIWNKIHLIWRESGNVTNIICLNNPRVDFSSTIFQIRVSFLCISCHEGFSNDNRSKLLKTRPNKILNLWIRIWI